VSRPLDRFAVSYALMQGIPAFAAAAVATEYGVFFVPAVDPEITRRREQDGDTSPQAQGAHGESPRRSDGAASKREVGRG
jgi:hypothetical protein